MANDKMKVAWAPADKKAKPPKPLNNIQKRNLATYEELIKAGMKDVESKKGREQFKETMKRHRIDPYHYKHLLK